MTFLAGAVAVDVMAARAEWVAVIAEAQTVGDDVSAGLVAVVALRKDNGELGKVGKWVHHRYTIAYGYDIMGTNTQENFQILSKKIW